MTVGIRFAYDERLINWLRSQVAKDQRSWDAHSRQWRLSENAYHEFLQQFPSTKHIKNEMVECAENEYVCEYVTRPKYNVASSRVVSFGWRDGFIVIAISIEALESWFRVGNLYDTLQVDVSASFDEIRSAYKRLARQWHPDVCREENAREQFLRIKRAHDILTGDKRKTYDLGLKIFSSSKKVPIQPRSILPLRSGVITGEIDTNVKPTITKILSWKDVTNDQGQVLVSNWRNDTYEMQWINKETQ